MPTLRAHLQALPMRTVQNSRERRLVDVVIPERSPPPGDAFNMGGGVAADMGTGGVRQRAASIKAETDRLAPLLPAPWIERYGLLRIAIRARRDPASARVRRASCSSGRHVPSR